MTDVLITDIDDAVLQRLQARALSAGITLEELAARILRAEAHCEGAAESTGALLEELAAMRASQPRPTGDVAADVRELRDGRQGDMQEGQAA